MKQVRIGLVGTGYIGRCHAIAYAQAPTVFPLDAELVLEYLAEITPELAEKFQTIAQSVDAINNIITSYEMSMGADDFADYLVDKPGVYGLLGSQSGEETAYGHHHEKFDIDEAVLPIGVELEVSYILSRLEN